MATPENYCPHRERYHITFTRPVQTAEGETVDLQAEPEVTRKVTIPMCKILIDDGAHFPQCKAPVSPESHCPVPLMVSGEISRQEGQEWLTQIQSEQVNQPQE